MIINGHKTIKTKLNLSEDLIGHNDWSKIIFEMFWAGVAENGISFTGKDARVIGIDFTEYETFGAALKFQNVTESILVSGCTFSNIGSIQWYTGAETPWSYDDVVTNQVISGHQSSAVVTIAGNKFKRCALNNRDWSHCIYIDGRILNICQNNFVSCGNPFAPGKPGFTEKIVVCDNRISLPQKVMDRRGVERPTYLMNLHPDVDTLVAMNTWEGEADYPITGHPRPDLHKFHSNDWSGMTLRNPNHFAADTGLGKSYSWSEWVEMGFDQNSKPPRNAV